MVVVLEHQNTLATCGESDVLAFKKSYLEKRGVDPAFVPDELVSIISSGTGLDLSPIAAVVGGILGQEVIKVLSAKSKPFLNFFLFDGQKGPGVLELIQPLAESSAVAVAKQQPNAADVIEL